MREREREREREEKMFDGPWRDRVTHDVVLNGKIF